MNIAIKLRCEETEQIEFMCWCKTHEDQYPDLKMMFHVPNGGSRNKREAIALKQMGVKAGVSDLLMLVPHGKYHGLIIEMKYGSNKLQDSQRDFLQSQMAAGYCCAVCYSSNMAKELVRAYMSLGWSDEITEDLFREGIYKIHKLWHIPVMKEEKE